MKRLFVAVFIIAMLCISTVQKRLLEIEEEVMAITKSTTDLIMCFEGFRNKAYQDSRGLWTIGVGHLIKPNEQHLIHTTLTNEQVADLLKSDLQACDEAIASSVKVPLNQNQYDALYSLCFNIGVNGFKASSVVKKLNSGDYKGAADAILLWNKPAVLESRRHKERELFLSDI